MYPLDYFSILHFILGIIGYICAFSIIKLFMSEFVSLLITYLTIILSGTFWEIAENTFLIEMKVFKERDYVVNSQIDVLLVFLGGILGCYLYKLPMLISIFVIGGLSIAFIIAKICTKFKFWKKKSKK